MISSFRYIYHVCVSVPSSRYTGFVTCKIWNGLLDLIYGCLRFEKFMIDLLPSSIFLGGYRWGEEGGSVFAKRAKEGGKA